MPPCSGWFCSQSCGFFGHFGGGTGITAVPTKGSWLGTGRVIGPARRRGWNMRVGQELAERWPRIALFLRVDSGGWISASLHWFDSCRRGWEPADQAAAWEEFADFYRWRLARQPRELAGKLA